MIDRRSRPKSGFGIGFHVQRSRRRTRRRARRRGLRLLHAARRAAGEERRRGRRVRARRQQRRRRTAGEPCAAVAAWHIKKAARCRPWPRRARRRRAGTPGRRPLSLRRQAARGGPARRPALRCSSAQFRRELRGTADGFVVDDAARLWPGGQARRRRLCVIDGRTLRARGRRLAGRGAGTLARPDRRVRLGPQHALHPRGPRPAGGPDRVVLLLPARGASARTSSTFPDCRPLPRRRAEVQARRRAARPPRSSPPACASSVASSATSSTARRSASSRSSRSTSCGQRRSPPSRRPSRGRFAEPNSST